MEAANPVLADEREALRTMRDRKARAHLEQYAPVWLVEEEYDAENNALMFSVVFHHPRYRWIKRRYRYDGVGDVLYYFGQVMIPEDEALDIEVTEPYIPAVMVNTLDSYGG